MGEQPGAPRPDPLFRTRTRAILEIWDEMQRLQTDFALAQRQRLTAPSVQRLASRNVNLTSPLESWKELHSILDEEGVDVAVLAVGRSHAMVITRHESIEARLEPAPKTCYCTWVPRCDGGGTKTGGNCNVGHQGTVYCV